MRRSLGSSSRAYALRPYVITVRSIVGLIWMSYTDTLGRPTSERRDCVSLGAQRDGGKDRRSPPQFVRRPIDAHAASHPISFRRYAALPPMAWHRLHQRSHLRWNSSLGSASRRPSQIARLQRECRLSAFDEPKSREQTTSGKGRNDFLTFFGESPGRRNCCAATADPRDGMRSITPNICQLRITCGRRPYVPGWSSTRKRGLSGRRRALRWR